MIALALGLAIVAAVGTLSVNASRSYRVLNNASEQIENGRYALKIIKDDLEHAGFLGFYGGDAPTYSTVPCDLTLPITTPQVPSVYCDTQTPKRLIISRASSSIDCSFIFDSSTNSCTSSPDCQQLNTNYTYIQSSASDYRLSSNCGPTTNSILSCTALSLKNPNHPNCPADLREYIVDSYTLESGTLYRTHLSRIGSQKEAIIDGIDRMDVSFGLDSSPQDGTPDTNYISASSITDFSNVVSVLIKLTACSTVNQQKTCRDFSQAVRLINISGRRE